MRVREGPLLEREGELAELDGWLGTVGEGVGRLVVVEGVAGIGKTRLLQWTRARAAEAGVQVLSARGSELERDYPFGLVRQLFEPVVHAAGETERAQLLGDAARLAGPIVGIEPDDRVHGGEELGDPTFATLNALYWLTANVSRERATLLAVDDLHWADGPSLRFLRFLLPRLEELPVLLALAARPAEPGTEAELLAGFDSDPNARVLRPAPLTPAGAADVVRQQLTASADVGFCAACHEATGGNPFMLRELLVELRAEGIAGTAAEASHLRDVAPATIKHSLLARLGRLEDAARGLARAVAVLGDDAEPREAAALAGLEPAAATRAADELAGAGILEARRPLRFVHPLVRNAIYADLPRGETAAAHERAAQLLKEGGAQPERVAVHLLATDPAADAGVVEILASAARRTLDRGAPETAVSYLRRALREPPPVKRRTPLLQLLMVAAYRAGDPHALDDVAEDAFERIAADPDALLESAGNMAQVLFGMLRLGELKPVLEPAIELAQQRDQPDLAVQLESDLVTWTARPPAEALARLERYADRLNPGGTGERLLLAQRAFYGSLLGKPAAEAADLAKRAIAGGRLVTEQGDGPVAAQTSMVLARADQLDAAEAVSRDITADTQMRRAGPSQAGAAYLRGYLAYQRGELARAEPEARAAIEAGRQGGYFVFPHFVALLVTVLTERGELEAADRELDAAGMAKEIPDIWAFMQVLEARGMLRLAQGRTQDGLVELLELGRRQARDRIVSVSVTPWRPHAAPAAAALGDMDTARRLVQEGLAEARAWGTPRAIGSALRGSGLVEGGERGLELLREAVAVLEPSPALLEHARALTDLGAALRRANRRAEAREPLRAALDWARQAGALAIARRAHEELEATGEKLRPLMAGGVESLTPSERRVAELAAEGQSNREIAQALFLSVKTVETHLGHAYSKLDIRSRSELPAVLADGSEHSDSVSRTVSPAQQI